jgi:hypothetical protein
MSQVIMHPFRDTFLSKHHIINRFRGGTSKPSNILKLWRDKHYCWHTIFHNYSIREIVINWERFRFYRERPQWKMIFHNLNPDEAKKLLQRVARIKRKLKNR